MNDLAEAGPSLMNCCASCVPLLALCSRLCSIAGIHQFNEAVSLPRQIHHLGAAVNFMNILLCDVVGLLATSVVKVELKQPLYPYIWVSFYCCGLSWKSV